MQESEANQNQNPGWYNENIDASPVQSEVNDTPVSWTASEYISHQKNSSWYVMLGLGSVMAAVLVYLITRDRISSSMMVLVAILFGIFAARQPRVLNYQISSHGITIGDKFYSFNDFKSFTLFEEGRVSSISLMPMKRFMPSLSVYYPPEQEEQIVGLIANYLPHEDREPDALDKLMHRVRF